MIAILLTWNVAKLAVAREHGKSITDPQAAKDLGTWY